MAVTPSGRISEAMDNVADLLSNSTNWQSWTGAVDADAAKAFIHQQREDPSSEPRPLALLSMDEESEWMSEKQAGGAQDHFFDIWTFSLVFQDNITESDSTDKFYDFLNNVSSVIDDMLNLSGRSGNVSIDSIKKNLGPGILGLEQRAVDEESFSGGGDAYTIGFELVHGSV